jgi:hypothetical protein
MEVEVPTQTKRKPPCAHTGPLAGLPVRLMLSSPDGEEMAGSVMLVQCRLCGLLGQFGDDGEIRWASEIPR